MKCIEGYLYKVQQEFYNHSITITDINGTYKNLFADCYNSKCTDDVELRDHCKFTCTIMAANRAIVDLNSQLVNCSKARNPDQCIKSIKNNIEKYRELIARTRNKQLIARTRIRQS